MSHTTLVSVVLIFFNEQRFLPEAVASVFAQTFDSWELLLVDDGSSDESSAMARAYAQAHPDRVRYLEHPDHANRGMSATRNLGITSARGQYLSFLDADDVWLPRKLEQQVALIQTHPRAAMVVGLTQWWYGWTGTVADARLDFVQRLNVPMDQVVEPPALLIAFLLDEFASIADILVTRESVMAVGGYEATFRGMYEDQAFHAKICAAYPIYISHQTWYRYRQHPDSCVAQAAAAGAKLAVRGIYLAWLDRYLTESGSRHAALQQVLNRELLPYKYPAFGTVRDAWRRNALAVKARLRTTFPRLNHAASRWRHAGVWPPVGLVRMGQLRRTTALSRDRGASRGLPVDRYYIEAFLARHSRDIAGRVLEVGDASNTLRFGGDRVTSVDVLHAPVADPGPQVTILDHLETAHTIASDAFDCVILTQTLSSVYDVASVLQTMHRILKPGGVLLATVPGTASTHRSGSERTEQLWSFTRQSMTRLLESHFPGGEIEVESSGNVLAATALLYGMAVEDLQKPELDEHDPEVELIVGVRARKAV